MAADDNLSEQQFRHYKVSFKTPGGSYLHHEVDAPNGLAAHRMAAMNLQQSGVSRQVRRWSANVKEA